MKSGSIDIIKDIYSKHSKAFVNYVTDIINSIKIDNSTINPTEINDFVFNSVLRDIHLSKYTTSKIFNLVEVDIIPESYTFYGEDVKDIDEIDENEDVEPAHLVNNAKVSLKYNSELATDVWSNIMIYGGLTEYKAMIDKIIDDVAKINVNAAKRMKA